MRKITVFDFCSQIGAASDEIPVVVKASMQERSATSAAYTKSQRKRCREFWKPKSPMLPWAAKKSSSKSS